MQSVGFSMTLRTDIFLYTEKLSYDFSSTITVFTFSSVFFFYSFGIPGMFAVDGNLDFPLFLCKQFEEFNYQSFADFMQSKWAAV